MLLWLGAGGCYWLRYDAVARTHVELLVAMAAKLGDVTERRGPPARLAEYRYPLERARDFMRIVEPRLAGRSSLEALAALCDAYEEAVAAAAHTDASGVRSAVARVRAQAPAVLAALDREAAD